MKQQQNIQSQSPAHKNNMQTIKISKPTSSSSSLCMDTKDIPKFSPTIHTRNSISGRTMPVSIQKQKTMNVYQNNVQEQQLYQFWFKITPLQILNVKTISMGTTSTSTSTYTSTNNKSIVIKLGNKEQKCKCNINTNTNTNNNGGNRQEWESAQIINQVLYSKLLNKYCSIKGIIKIYDINKDNSEVIACVGAFGTQQLLTNTISNHSQSMGKIVKIQRDIGPYKIIMNVQIKNLGKIQKSQKSNTSNNSSNKIAQSPNKQKILQTRSMSANKVSTTDPGNNIKIFEKQKQLQKQRQQQNNKIKNNPTQCTTLGLMTAKNNSNNIISMKSLNNNLLINSGGSTSPLRKLQSKQQNQQGDYEQQKKNASRLQEQNKKQKDIQKEKEKEKEKDKKFIKSPRISQSDCQQIPTPYIMDDSSDYIQEFSKSRRSSGSNSAEASQQLKGTQKQAIGQQLIQQRRKNKQLQQKIQKFNIKVQLLRKNLAQKNNEIKGCYLSFRNFVGGLQYDTRGQYTCQMNQRKRQITLKYKANVKFKQLFQDFISFMVKKITQTGGVLGSQRTIQDQAQINRILSKIQNFENERIKIYEQTNNQNAIVSQLKNQLHQKIAQITVKDALLRRKMEQIAFLQQKFKKMLEQKRGLQALNQYLQQRDSQMQQIINTKQNTIENLKKILNENSAQLEQLEVKNEKLVKIVQNLQLQIDEMKQQNSNLQQIIQNYRQNYGDLKTAKDRALQRQFKQCLRWIDQQNHDEQLSNLQDTTFQSNDHSLNTNTNTVNSIMRSIGEIQNMPLQEISLIRRQVINVLKRLDQFVARNSSLGVNGREAISP